mgnify:CR=1 FL=1
MSNFDYDLTRQKRNQPLHSVPMNYLEALAAFAGARIDADTRHVSVNKRRTYVDNMKRVCVATEPVFTFTRTGPQEFAPEANGKENFKPWWERAR